MKKIVDTYAFGVKESQGGRCQRWWEENPFGNKKRKIQRNSEVQDLDVKRFLSTFSLKCVEFGNWLQQGERYDHLLAAGYALHELSKLVGKNIGFDYNVGLAFGARGMRGAVAHWESVERMINLTKQKGAGSLAHEYAHALDCILGSHSDRHSKYSYLSGGRSVANILKDNVAGDLRAYVNQIVDYIKTTESYKKLFARTSKSPYYHRRTEVFARFFEQYVAYKTNSVNRYLCCSWSLYSDPGNIEYLSEDEFMQILPVADKFARRIKDITSEDGLPAQKTPYPTAIVYKPKTKEEPKTAATKQPQDTKATKKEAVVLSKEVKDAIMDRLMRHIDNANYGLFSTYKENSKTPRILFQNKIEIDYSKGYKGTVKQNGKLIATIEGNFAKKKKDGMYKQLKPTVKYL
ncbi:MAG: hypothetical protein IKA83_05940 [Paludibacteraceae bacterium]|nr:hypothetical protein [Paludibacteraceae bacterium]